MRWSAMLLVATLLTACAEANSANDVAPAPELTTIADSPTTTSPSPGSAELDPELGQQATATATAPPRVLLVGDSTLLAVEAYDVSDSLRGFTSDLEVAPCRALGVPSCGESPRPPNAVEVIRSSDGPYDIVVVMAGYDEWWTSFPQSLEQVAAASREIGARTLLFLNFTEGVGYVAPDGRQATEAFVRNNETLELIVATGVVPELVVADWFTYTADPIADEWLAADGIHLTPLGARAVGDYISRWVAHLTQRPCPADPAGPVCENPDAISERPSREELLVGQ